MLKDKEKNNKKREDNKILRKSKSLNQQSVKRKTPSWLLGSHWLNKRNKKDKERKCKPKWKSKGLNKWKRNLWWTIKRNKNKSNNKRKSKKKNWQNNRSKLSKEECS